ncbi:hypothetical protein J3R83DRAFT_4765 [Lanmaoa asiatica]|nr:hypothetical protein J3R83DRAFT_4765 [Lanmaoa asiatica]
MSDPDFAAEQQPLLPIPYDNPRSRANCPMFTWRENVACFLESRRLHAFVLTLIAIDAVCVVTDIAYGFLVDGCATPEGPFWLEVLANISLAITTFFLLEIPLALWAFGIKFYVPFYGVPHAPLHIFDAIIVVTTFVLEFVLKGRERELVGLLVVLRLWRLIKLVGGITVGAGEIEEQVLDELEQTKRQLEGSTAALAKAREENRKLRARVVWLETGGSEGSEL